MNKSDATIDQAVVPTLNPIERGEEALENLYGPEVLPDLDLSSLPESFQALLGGEADPHDPAVQQEVLRFIDSDEGAVTRRLLGTLIGDRELAELLRTGGDNRNGQSEPEGIREKLVDVIHRVTSGTVKKELQKNYSTIQFGKVKTIRHSQTHVGRNDQCPCGSGKKFKNCCIHKSP